MKIAEGTELTSFDSNGKEQRYDKRYQIFLNPDGSFDVDELDRHLNSVKEISSKDFLKPIEVLVNFTEVLAKKKKQQQKDSRKYNG